uniref:Uncharacterized protein n=1 Tax=Parascaris equorum TaxID=6256 RepID=A0A914RM76_PAREQ
MNLEIMHNIVSLFQPSNVLPPLCIDVSKDVHSWTLPDAFMLEGIDFLLNINMIHISSDAAVDGLFKVSILKLKLCDMNKRNKYYSDVWLRLSLLWKLSIKYLDSLMFQ